VNTLPVILLAAAGVGFGHAVMPDHWLPLAVLSRARRYGTGAVVRLSLAAAVAHVLVSLILGAVVIGVGLQFRAAIAGHTDLVVGSILLATGAVFLLLELRGKGHGHGHDHGHDHGPHSHDVHHDGAHTPGAHDHGHHEDGASHHDHDHDTDDAHEHLVLAGHSGGTAVLDRAAARAQTQTGGTRGIAALLIPFGAAASPDLTILPVFLAASALGAGAAIGSLAAFALVTAVTIVGLTIAAALGARLLTASWTDRGANLLTAGTLLLIGTLVASGLI
jgi:nickel/cobalt exporter